MKTTTNNWLKVVGNIILLTGLLMFLVIMLCSCTYQAEPRAGDMRYEPITTYSTWK